MSFQKKIILVDKLNQEIGIIALEQLYADTYAIKIKKTENTLSLPLWSKAFTELMTVARAQNAHAVQFRLIKNKGLDALEDPLLKNGFIKIGGRIEFKKSVDQLPTDLDQSRIQWKSAKDLLWSEQQIADALLLVAEDDPALDPNEDPLMFIQDFINHNEYTSGLECIHFGFVNNQLAAMTVVQFDFNPGPDYGWSRISYMGVTKAFRNKGIGKLAHQHSFKIMKLSGGLLYHGGTSDLNRPMIKLFEYHGCEAFKEMEEWVHTLHEVQHEKN